MEEEVRFNKFFDILMKLEGGISDNPNDKGGLTNFGITQLTYNAWTKSTKSVKNITKEEAKNIYKLNYYKPVNYIENEFAHYLLFDLCVNSGLGKVKACIQEVSNPNDPNAILTWRRQKYNSIVKADPSQQVFLKGWMNRLKLIEKEFK